MDKLTLAHEYFLGIISNPSVTLRAEDLQIIQYNAWVYADAMQDEANKRQNNTTVASHVESSEYYPHYEAGRDYPPDCYVIYNGKKTLAVSISNEWQPDWSEAPDWANYWSIDFGGDCGRWYSEEPKKDVVYYQGKVNSLEQDSPTFGYIGLWQESLRKRPE